MAGRARVDLDEDMKKRLREHASRAGITPRAAVEVGVEQVLRMTPNALHLNAQRQARRNRPEWWPLLCTHLENQRRRGKPITTQVDGTGAKNRILAVNQRAGFIKLMSERSHSGEPRTLTVADIAAKSGPNESIRLRLKALGEKLLKERGGPRE